MILHGNTSESWNNFQLFSLGEITRNYFTYGTSIIKIPFIRNKFHNLLSDQSLKFSVSCDKVRILLI